MSRRKLFALGATVLGALAIAPLAQAQATRTWVSGVGDDVNPCSRTAPCKTFAGAISKTARGGEISVLDPGGFGTVTITKSITINGRGTLGGILAAGSPQGVLVNITDPADTAKAVILRDLDINGAGTGTNGIRFLAGNRLQIQRVSVNGFTGAAVSVVGTSGARNVFISNSEFSENSRGVNVVPTAPATAKVSISNTEINAFDFGITALIAAARISARNVTFTGASVAGVYAEFGKINLDSCLVQNNGIGIDSQSNASIRVSDTTISDNVTGLFANSGGAILSRSNNTLQDNDTNGAFTGTYGPS
jgi:hypothetical protein